MLKKIFNSKTLIENFKILIHHILSIVFDILLHFFCTVNVELHHTNIKAKLDGAIYQHFKVLQQTAHAHCTILTLGDKHT
jgi:hypothetical protein